jgi:uncharacterized repeat protein (TIGR04052 family)
MARTDRHPFRFPLAFTSHSIHLMRSFRTPFLFLSVALASVAACTTDSTTGPAAPQAVTIEFGAVVGSADFVCGQSYDNLGTPATTAAATDFMMYVHNVRLVTPAGAEVPVTLTADNLWQADNVALLDFAAGGAGTPCPNASSATNTQVVGTAPAGSYTGVKFDLGLPFDRNHQDQTTAAGPYSPTRMFWSWNAGYKALRLDLTSTGFPSGWFIHLGSTGCTPTGSASTVPTSCVAPNRPSVSITGFDLTEDRIVADVAALVAGSDLNQNQGGPAGCMSGTTDLDCPSIFSSFGLAFNGGAAPASQTFFRRVAR